MNTFLADMGLVMAYPNDIMIFRRNKFENCSYVDPDIGIIINVTYATD